jgi:hypothetical protein
MARYFYTDKGKTLGPVNREQILNLILKDVLSLDSLLMDTRSPRWIKIRDIPELMHFLYESDIQISDWAEEIALSGESDESIPLFFHIPTTRLITLSIVTFGWYELYWLYMNWRFLHYFRKNSSAKAFWLDLINPLGVIRIFQHISNDKELRVQKEERDFTVNGIIWILALLTLFIFASGIINYLTRIPFLVSIFVSFVALTLSLCCIMPIQNYINTANMRFNKKLSAHTFGHYGTIILGILTWIYVLILWIPALF